MKNLNNSIQQFSRQTLVAIVLFLGFSQVLMALPISREAARTVAARFMDQRGMRISSRGPMKAPRQGGQAGAAYYVFNAEDNGGFVIVSGDDRTLPVLGYCDSGTFDEDHIADGLRWLLQTYTEQMEQLDTIEALNASDVPNAPKAPPSAPEGATIVPSLYDKSIEAPSGAVGGALGALGASVASASSVRHNVAPLLTTNWNQGDPYNLLCPNYYKEDGTQGGHSATGCVATAMAQVVAYYRWPAQLKRSIPGYRQTYNTTQGEKAVTLNTVPIHSVIDWDNILDNYDGSATEAQRQAIAQLMLWVGMTCKMNYGEQSSSGYSEGIDGLVNYFDFDDGTHVAKRDLYTAKSWNELIYNEIASGHPVPYGGQNSGGGHAFVLDGYDLDGLFHVNWGWGGMNNGYFRIDILDPNDNSGIGASPTPGGYNMGQDCIIGMRRPDGQKADESDTPQSRYKLTVNDWEVRGTNRFFANYINWSGVAATWNMGIGYVNDEGKLTPVGSYFTQQLNQGYYMGYEFVVRGLPQGTYHLVPISKRSTDREWRTHVSPDLHFVLVEVDASGEVVNMEIRPLASTLAMTALTFPGNHKRGDNQTVSAVFRNDGDDELFLEIHLLASRTQEKGADRCRTAIAVAPGQEADIALNFTPDATGTWNIWLATDGQGQNIVGQGTIEITEEGLTQNRNLRYASHTVTNRSNGVIYGNRMQGKVTILNQGDEPFDGRVRLWLFKLADNGYFYGAASVYQQLHIDPKRTAQAEYAFSNLDLDATYNMSILYAEGGDIQDGGLKQMGTTRPGIVYWQQNKTLAGMAPATQVNTPSGAVAIDLSSMGNTLGTVKPNNNPNTLYILADGADIPAGLEDRNVVVGRQAAHLSLTDGYSFISPITFQAAEASYSRTPQPGRPETIVLPFAVDNLPAAPQVLAFTQVTEQGEALFTPTLSMDYATPYLLLSDDDTPLTLTATDVTVTSTLDMPMAIGTDSHRFVGTTVTERVGQACHLADDGKSFVYAQAQTSVAPFRAYFTAPEGITTVPVVKLESTGISQPLDSPSTTACYDLQGRRVTTEPVRPGVYIKNHRVVIVK